VCFFNEKEKMSCMATILVKEKNSTDFFVFFCLSFQTSNKDKEIATRFFHANVSFLLPHIVSCSLFSCLRNLVSFLLTWRARQQIQEW